MMEAMTSMKNIMEVNAVTVAATSVVAEVDPAPPSDLNQINHPNKTFDQRSPEWSLILFSFPSRIFDLIRITLFRIRKTAAIRVIRNAIC